MTKSQSPGGAADPPAPMSRMPMHGFSDEAVFIYKLN